MRILLSVVLTAVVLLAGCATQAPLTDATSKPQAAAPVVAGKSNRFEMTQNGRRMSADDFDRWMKARGIRVAKGKPAAATRQARTTSRGASTSEVPVVARAAPKPAPKSPARSASKSAPKGGTNEREQATAASGTSRRTVR